MKLSNIVSTSFALAVHNAAFALKTDHVSSESPALPRDNPVPPARADHLNALMVGARGVGKTTIQRAWLDHGAQKNKPPRHPTAALSISRYRVGEHANEKELRVHDLPPYSEDVLINTRNRHVMREIRLAHVVVVVFDVTRPQTLQDALNWKTEVEKYAMPQVPFVLLMNKAEDEALSLDHLTNRETGFGNFFNEQDLSHLNDGETGAQVWLSFCQRMGFTNVDVDGVPRVKLAPISAYENYGVDSAFRYMYEEANKQYHFLQKFSSVISQMWQRPQTVEFLQQIVSADVVHLVDQLLPPDDY